MRNENDRIATEKNSREEEVRVLRAKMVQLNKQAKTLKPSKYYINVETLNYSNYIKESQG